MNMKGNKTEMSTQRRQNSLDIGKLFGYSTKETTREKIEEKLFDNKFAFTNTRIFLNHVDQFNGKYIAQVLHEQEPEDSTPEMELTPAEEEDEEDEVDEDEEEEEEGERRGDSGEKDEGIVKEDENEDSQEDLEKDISENASAEEMSKTESTSSVKRESMYEIIGTIKDSKFEVSENISEVLQYSKDDELFLSKILSCGFIIYDITRDPQQIDEATWVLQAIEHHLDKLFEDKPKAFKKLTEIRAFVLISSMMTWAMTQPINLEDPEMPFIEEDYKKRKPHPNYKEHIKLERLVTKVGRKYKDKLKTLVITTGIPYGEEEDILHFLFRMAWENELTLPVIYPGTNFVPLIHIKDLAHILHLVLQNFPRKTKFIFAIELPPIPTLHEIVKPIANEMGSGHVKTITGDEALLYKEMSHDVYDLLNINLNAEPLYLSENMEVQWRYEVPFSENIKQIVQEFKKAKMFKPLIIFIHGPPGIGKTELSKRICDYYKLHYINIDNVVQESIQELRDLIAKVKEKRTGEKDYEEDEEEEDEEKFETLEETFELLEDIEDSLERNQGKLDDEYKIRFIKKRMLSNSCQNQGYVIDGYPTTIEEAKMLFDAGEEDTDSMEIEDDSEIGLLMYNKAIMPEFIVSLEASDSYLLEKIFENTIHDVEKDQIRKNYEQRLNKFRENNTEILTVLNYFDEHEIHPDVFSVMEDQTPYLESTFQKIVNIIGKPRNYGPSEEEVLQKAKQKEYARKMEEKILNEKRREEERKAHEERLEKVEKYNELIKNVKRREEESLTREAIPIRRFLMEHVMPVLTEGLVEVAKVKPDDPVDYLAEYLFKQNSEEKTQKAVLDVEKCSDGLVTPSSSSLESEASAVQKFIYDIVYDLTNV